jgi:hypothetical protein
MVPVSTLEAVRRADWLLLLGDRPGRAAYVGADEAVALALEAAGVGCDRLARASLVGAPAGAYDLVVLHEPDLAAVEAAAGLVGAGGWLYVETRNPLGRPRRRGCRAALERRGLRATAVWLWPSFRDCREIVPLADAAALRQAFGRRRRPLGRLAALAAGPLARTRLLEIAAPCVALVARRSRGEQARP